MRDPGAVIAVAHLALLVGADLGEGRLVCGRIVLDRNLRRHPAHREGAARMAGLHQQRRIGAQERFAHHHLAAVRKNAVFVFRELLDEGEDVVPSPGVQPSDVVAQLVEDFLHLERRRQRLDQHGRPDGADRDAEPLLREHEYLAPQARFLVRLELRQIKIRRGAGGDLRLRVMEEIEAEIE